MNLKEFKEKIKENLEKQGFSSVPKVLQEIEDSNYGFDKVQFSTHRTTAQSQLTALNPTLFIKQLIIFIDTLWEDKAHKVLYNIPNRPSFFIGRKKTLSEIHKEITEKDNRKNIYLVNGVGGMGKTTIVQEYLYRQECLNHFQNILHFSVHNDTESAFIFGVADAFDISMTEYPQQDDKRRVVLNALKGLEGNTLIVIDNANDKDQLVETQSYFQRITIEAKCKFLITTRTNPDEYKHAIIEIGELEISDAIKLFLHHYEETVDNEKPLIKLLEHISRHTLLIELLAKVGYKKGYFIDNLHELLLEEDRLMEALNKDELKRKIVIGEHADATQQKKLATLYQYIYSLFKPELLKEESQKTMARFFSVLPPEDMPLIHLKKLWQVEKKDENDFEEDLDFLQQWGWLTGKHIKTIERQLQNLAYKMHPLVQEVVYEKLTPDINNVRPLVKSVTEIMGQPLNQSYEFQAYAKSIIDKLNFLNSLKQ
ncbi:MAG: NB-ARC domain-containing protein [Bacteroidota bacterium]|nr:NB-ARC domain-containing protein [Bacteroidota bacterium]